MSRTPQTQLVHFLIDMYAVEQQSLAQLVSAPEVADIPALAQEFEAHHAETQEQSERLLQHLEALGESPSSLRNAVMSLGGKAFLLFARTMPETPGRLVDHSYAYEAMEWAGHDMLLHFGEAAGDATVVELAKQIRDQEREMMERLERHFDTAEADSHATLGPEERRQHVVRHLKEVHAFERQGEALFEKSKSLARSERLERLYQTIRTTIDDHAAMVEQRLAELGSKPSGLSDAAMSVAGSSWGLFFQMQSDTPAKLAAFTYAVLHLQIGAYELLARTVRRTSDAKSTELCTRVIAEKRDLAQQLADSFATAVSATLQEVTT